MSCHLRQGFYVLPSLSTAEVFTGSLYSVSETMGRDPNVRRQGFMNGSRAALFKIGFSQNNVFKQCFMSSFLKSNVLVTSQSE